MNTNIPKIARRSSADWNADKFGVFAALNYIGSFEDLPDSDFDTVPDYENDHAQTSGPSRP